MDYPLKPQPVDVRSKIINLVKIRGPILPVHATKEANSSILITSAYLSQLVSEKSLKLSNMKVGGSPLYFLPGQELMLENFIQYLPGKEKEIYLLLKERKILEDEKLEPALRVAIRSIKDFAFPLQIDSKVFWRHISVSENEALQEIKRSLQEIKPQIELKEIKPQILIQEPKPLAIEKKHEKAAIKIEKQEKVEPIEKIPEKPVLKIRQKKEKIKDSSFLEEVKQFLLGKDIELIQEIFYDKKEVQGKVRINSDLGKISLLLIAQDKKRLSESDIISAYQKAIESKMPCLFLSRADTSEKMRQVADLYKNIIKLDKIKS